MENSASPFSAAEQGLGYIFQPRFALLKILELPESSAVFLEKEDDVEFVTENGIRSLASLKHKASGDKLTNLSTDFWKSVRIWLAYYRKSGGVSSEGRFLLFTTAEIGKDTFLRLFTPNAQSEQDRAELAHAALAASTSSSIRNIMKDLEQLSEEERSDFYSRITILDATPRIDELPALIENEQIRLKARVADLEKSIGADDSGARLASTLNNISMHMSGYIAALGGEFSQYPARLDLYNLTVALDRPGRPILMQRTGGGENHLAYHLAALLALHRFARSQNHPVPSFLLIDQPTQVYFPSEASYEAAGGSIEKTEQDADLEAVRRLFEVLDKFAKEDAPGFQIIVTEHANLRNPWFQQALVEGPWTKPPALVPEDWPDLAELAN